MKCATAGVMNTTRRSAAIRNGITQLSALARLLLLRAASFIVFNWPDLVPQPK